LSMSTKLIWSQPQKGFRKNPWSMWSQSLWCIYYSPEAAKIFVILSIITKNIFFLFSSKHQQIVNSNNCTCHLKKWNLFLIDVQVVIVNGGWRILFIKRKCTSHVSGVVPIAWSITRPIGRKLNSNDMETRNEKHVPVGRCPTTCIVKKPI
jgi:hypothetical protein